MQVKFICLNLWLGGKIFDPILEFLEKESPDVLVLQEVYDGKDSGLEKRLRSFEFIRQQLNYNHSFFSPAVIDIHKEGKIEQGNAILSKLPIVKTKTVFYDIPIRERKIIEGPGDFSLTPRNLQHVEIEAGDRSINIFNTQGIWGKDGEDNERRLKMSEIIVREIEGKGNVILAGDFNTYPKTETVAMIEKKLKNIFKDKLATTFNMKRKNNPLFIPNVVDFVFASENIKVVDRYCPDVDISDHLPLVCVFEI
ncbi:MAG: endonuclease/exonuclease/phosphatase family protein [Parcubacteria group bacterium]|jgi:endonuclease/exonuclease/phosphatase family metal-dependent hydrolase